jgi:hypothetical protein
MSPCRSPCTPPPDKTLFPTSYIRGRNRFDYIFVSIGISQTVLRSGSLTYYSLLRGDHLPYYIDLSSSLLYADTAHEIQPPLYPSLCLQDPCVIAKYQESLHEQLTFHKVLEKVQLHSQITPWTTELTQ